MDKRLAFKFSILENIMQIKAQLELFQRLLVSDIPAGFRITGATDFRVRGVLQLCFTLANSKWLGFTDAFYNYVVEQAIRVLLLGYAFISPFGCVKSLRTGRTCVWKTNGDI